MPTNKDFAAGVFHAVPPGAHIYGTAFTQPPDRVRKGAWFGGPIKPRSLAGKSNYTRGDCNTFYVVSSFYPDAEGKVMRRKAQFAAAHVLTLDDIGDGPSAKISWDRIKLDPSFVIETSPDNCQPGYILKEPETDADYFNRVVDALIAQGLASPVDPGMKGVTRYVRFPGGLNNKTKYDLPWRHVCRAWHPERRYSLQDIIDAYGLMLAPPTPVYQQRPGVKVKATDDLYLKCLSDLGLVQTGVIRSGGDFEMVDILCPFYKNHSDRVDVGAVYVIGGGFRCHHGSCANNNFKAVKVRLRTHFNVDADAIDVEIAAAHEALMALGLENILKVLNHG
jgi:hypothetical protein